MASSIGATAAWASSLSIKGAGAPIERRDLFPEGVASGDPDHHSVVFWTRRPYASGKRAPLTLEVADDPTFAHPVIRSRTSVCAESDWTCRVLGGNLEPATVYWYRFVDSDGNSSRTGRTMTAPVPGDDRPVRFAFVSCQNTNLGEQNAWRRMICEDEQTRAARQLGFVVHLGDFIYEIVCYPTIRPTLWGRRVRDILRYSNGERHSDFHVPTTLEDYRTIYRAYLHDESLQDARARWPFVPIWDNHEFSAGGWQSFQVFSGQTIPAQVRKVAANQAWFEYLPARTTKASGSGLERFDPPQVVSADVSRFDAAGLGQERNNLTAIRSLTGYRTLRWGRHVELILTDQRSYRAQQPGSRPEAKALWSKDFPNCIPLEWLEALDAGRSYNAGHPAQTVGTGAVEIANFRQADAPFTILGNEQKRWFLRRLKETRATWKIWGCTTGTLDRRVDLQNLPPGMTRPWPGKGYATYEDGDHGSAWVERAEIYNWILEHGITGFVTIAGDRHSFWAGLAAPTLPPKDFRPVGVAFVTAALSTPSSGQLLDESIPRDHPLRTLFFADNAGMTGERRTVANLLLRHGVRACLEYARTGDARMARLLSNPEVAPHLTFLDLDAYGYSTITATGDALECEFVCIPEPELPADRKTGGPVRYRVLHRTTRWQEGEVPQLEQSVIEGNPELSL